MYADAHVARYDVVDPRSAGLELGPGNPPCLGMRPLGHRHVERGLPVLDLVAYRDGLLEADDEVGLADPPTALRNAATRRGQRVELSVGRCVRRVARGRARFDPCQDRRAVGRIEVALALEFALVLGSSAPGRHVAALDGVLDARGPAPRVVVTHEGHRCDHTADVRAGGLVARDAVLVEDGEGVRVERGRVGVLSLRRGRREQRDHGEEGDRGSGHGAHRTLQKERRQ